MAESKRLPALDGLRGVAALIVLIHHSLMTVPVLALPYVTGRPSGSEPPIASVMLYSPLHVLWAGPEAVYVFFLISGVVLGLPAFRPKQFDWLAYFPKRLVRLYFPVAIAVILTAGSILLIPRVFPEGSSVWLTTRGDLRPPELVKDFTLLFGISGLLAVLWSLRWEAWFSLLLPAYVWFAKIWPKTLWLKVLLVGGVLTAGGLTTQPVFFYMPMFAIGILLAFEVARIQEVAQRLLRSRWVGSTLFLACLLFITSYWLLLPWIPFPLLSGVTRPIVVLGAIGLVLLAMFWEPLSAKLQSKFAKWLGLVSFSLYLIHEPVVVGLAVILGPQSASVAIPLGIVLSLLLAWAFYKLIESPSHRLSQNVAAAIASRGKEQPPPASTARSAI